MISDKILIMTKDEFKSATDDAIRLAGLIGLREIDVSHFIRRNTTTRMRR